MKDEEEIREYVKELGETAKTFDPEKYRAFLRKYRGFLNENVVDLGLSRDDRFLKGCMAKTVMMRTDIEEEYKAQARKILDEMGWSYTICPEEGMKLKELRGKTAYKTYEIIRTEDDGRKLIMPPLLYRTEACFDVFGEWRVLSVRDFEDRESTSIIIEEVKES